MSEGVGKTLQSTTARLTRFLCADGELFAGLTAANLVEGVHADAVDRGWVEVDDVGLVDGGGDVARGLLEVPRIWEEEKAGRSVQATLTHRRVRGHLMPLKSTASVPGVSRGGGLPFLDTGWGLGVMGQEAAEELPVMPVILSCD